MGGFRVIVTAWRAASSQHHGDVFAVALGTLDEELRRDGHTDITLVHGDCRGGDEIAARIALDLGWAVEPHPAQNHPIRDFGPWPGAGPRRNTYMCSLGADLMLAFPGPGSTGTWQCLSEARRRDIPFRGYPLQTRGAHQ